MGSIIGRSSKCLQLHSDRKSSMATMDHNHFLLDDLRNNVANQASYRLVMMVPSRQFWISRLYKSTMELMSLITYCLIPQDIFNIKIYFLYKTSNDCTCTLYIIDVTMSALTGVRFIKFKLTIDVLQWDFI